MNRWTGRHIKHAILGRGIVLTDLADLATHTRGKLLVRFDKNNTRRWAEARNCELCVNPEKG